MIVAYFMKHRNAGHHWTSVDPSLRVGMEAHSPHALAVHIDVGLQIVCTYIYRESAYMLQKHQGQYTTSNSYS